MTSRSFVFTQFGSEDIDLMTKYKHIHSIDNENVRYLVCQIEKTPSTSLLHIQGYIELHSSRRPNTIKELLNDNSAHIEYRKGSRDEARNYCMKLETRAHQNEIPYEYGKWISGQGFRSDFDNMFEMIKDRKSDYELMNECPGSFIRYSRGLRDCRFVLNQHEACSNFRKLEVHIIYGHAGVGKTRYIYDKFGYDKVFKLEQDGGDNSNVWFDGYNGEKILMLDDFYGWIKYGFMLNVLDGYPLRLAIKGGHTWANWDKVYITSNKRPDGWYAQGISDALARRISTINRMNSDGKLIPLTTGEWYGGNEPFVDETNV